MSSNTKLYVGLGVALVVLLVSAFVAYKIYDAGYREGFTVCETQYRKELQKLKDAQLEEQERVSNLEQQLFDASKKYETISQSYLEVQKENQKWKTEAKSASKEALGADTVKRLNEVLEQYSSSHR